MKFLSLLVSFFSIQIYASEGAKSICGTDDRLPSLDPKVARVLGMISDSAGCTLTMISDSCAISAGHCHSTLGVAEFNTPPSVDGRIQHSAPEDIYEVDKDSVVFTYRGVGVDWAVMKLRANNITGLLPGAMQGHYEVSFDIPTVRDEVVITGYGMDKREPERHLAQQTQTGIYLSNDKRAPTVMYHNIDTQAGNSGSSIISRSTGKIIAIHTNGGCFSRRGSGGKNAATLIHNSPELVRAIKACLASE